MTGKGGVLDSTCGLPWKEIGVFQKRIRRRQRILSQRPRADGAGCKAAHDEEHQSAEIAAVSESGV
jgi:hypothetical protein